MDFKELQEKYQQLNAEHELLKYTYQGLLEINEIRTTLIRNLNKEIENRNDTIDSLLLNISQMLEQITKKQ